jgi:hypothetical protein
MEIYLMLIPFALLGVSQRSISDEFASWTMSPVSVSPFICLAGYLSTLLWITYGRYTRLPWPQCFRLAVRKSGVSGDERRREIRKPQTYLAGFLFIACLWQAAQAFAIQHIFWEKVWIAQFIASYLLHLCVDILATYADDDDHFNEADDEGIQTMFNIVDALSIIAYMIQMKAWVDIYGKLVNVALTNYSEDRVNNAIMASIGLAVILSLSSPRKGPMKILHGLWALRNWNTNDATPIVVCVFAMFLMFGFPVGVHSSASLIATLPEHVSLLWPMISTPLGTLSVVVFVVYVTSFLHTLVCKVWGIPIPAEFAENVEDGEEAVLLSRRWNVVVKSNRKWRETLSLAFAILNFAFGAVHYLIVYPGMHPKEM